MLYRKTILILFCTLICIRTIFTMEQDVEQSSQHDSIIDYTDLLQAAFADRDSQQSFSSLKTIADDQAELDVVLNKRIAEFKNVLFYLDKIALCEATNKPLTTFLSNLTEERQKDIINVYANYIRFKKLLFQAIEAENIGNFAINLQVIQKSTHCNMPYLNNSSDEDLETIFAFTELEMERLVEIKNYLDSFNNFTWIAQNPKTARAAFIGLPIVCIIAINYICYHILFKFETNSSISIKKTTAIFALTNVLAFIGILVFGKIIPSNFLCCKKNTTKMATATIEKMRDLLMEQIEHKMRYLMQINRSLQARHKGHLELKGNDTSHVFVRLRY